MKLSICIATFKRAAFIAETLASIIPQLTSEVELVVVDGASPDNTPEIVQGLVRAHAQVRYFREDCNSGVDVDYDKAVQYAAGEFVWLMTDDDLLKPQAVARVLRRLESDHDLLFVNAEIWNAEYRRLLKPSFLDVVADRAYSPGELELAFRDVGFFSSFIGGVVLRRSVWLRRDRRSYYGTLFVHVGVIFQHPPIGTIAVIAEPLIKIRYGNAMWTARGLEIWLFKWPELIWSFRDFSEQARASVTPREPWRRLRKLVLFRALGGYSIIEYRRFLATRVAHVRRVSAWAIAVAPAALINQLAALICLLFYRNKMVIYDLARSRHAGATTRIVARILNV
jgi:abequosyltransferase